MLKQDISYEGLDYGQKIATMGRQVAVPYRHSYTDYGKRNTYPYSFILTEKEVRGKVCVKLSPTITSPDSHKPIWVINTNNYRQSGLVCYLDTKYEGYAILSVRITKLATKSVYAEPVEYIEVANPLLLSMKDIGRQANDIFDSFLDDGRAIWHNKQEA